METCPSTGEACEAISLVSGVDTSLQLMVDEAAQLCASQSSVDVYEIGKVRLGCGFASYLVQDSLSSGKINQELNDA